MTGTINKDLISSILRLEKDQQEHLLRYVHELLEHEELKKRVAESEKAIEEGNVINLEEFKKNTEEWIRKKTGTK